MKLTLASLISLFAISAFAAEVKITSWGAINPNDYQVHAGEVCGKVIDGDGTEKILIVADPGKYQGEYMTTASPSGNFCMVVGTVRGKVEVTLVGTKASASKEF
jgi:hypothetical protein